MALSSASVVEWNSYSQALSPVVGISILFGPGERLRSTARSWLGGVIFILLLVGMTFVAILGVFVRTSIDTWIQFSLYIVPLIALVSGFYVYTSSAFNKLLKRRLSRKSLVEGFLESDQGIPWHESQRASWLRKAAIKNCFYPFSLEIYQWTAYVIFFTVFKSDSFAGSLSDNKVIEMGSRTWLPLYCSFWTMAMYITGFVAYSFILISRLTVRDVISFMCMFGDSPFLLYRPSEERNPVLESLNGRLEKPETGIGNRNGNGNRKRNRNSNVKGNRYKNRNIIILILLQFIQKIRKLVWYHAPPKISILQHREGKKSSK